MVVPGVTVSSRTTASLLVLFSSSTSFRNLSSSSLSLLDFSTNVLLDAESSPAGVPSSSSGRAVRSDAGERGCASGFGGEAAVMACPASKRNDSYGGFLDEDCGASGARNFR
jgi:hypothetical protein